MKLTRTQLANYLVTHHSDDAVNHVAAYLFSTGRAKEVDLVIREVEAVLSKRGRAVAHIASARKLDADQQRSIIKMLKERTNAQSVEIINNVDPSLLGGVVVSTPEMEVDLSVRNKLERLKRAV
jgi:F-type H+-transporting ATPase subunit delta